MTRAEERADDLQAAWDRLYVDGTDFAHYDALAAAIPDLLAVVRAARACWLQVPPNGNDLFQVAAHDALRDALAAFEEGGKP